MTDPKHAKVTTYTMKEDGSTEIQADSYYEQLSSIKQMIEQHVMTNPGKFLSDIISALSPITDKTSRELTIHIVTDERYNPSRITKTYTTNKEVYKKK